MAEIMMLKAPATAIRRMVTMKNVGSREIWGEW
jgi:hypothetical protein